MSFNQFLAIIKARWMLLAAIMAVTLILAAVIILILPNKYMATGTVVVDMRSPDPITGMIAPQSGQYIQTQVDIIQSDRVTRNVIRNLKLADNPGLRESWQEATDGQGDLESWIVNLIARNLEVVPSRNSAVIELQYEAADPVFAAAIVNQYIKAYIDTNLQLRVEPARQFGSMFAAQMNEARKKLQEAQDRLTAYQTETGIIATDERLDVESARLAELSAQLVSMQAATSDAKSRLSQSGVNSPDAMNNAVVSGLRAELARQETQLKEISARLGENHPLIVQARAGIAELRQRILAETANVGRSTGVSVQIAQQRESQTRALLQAQRERVLQLKAVRDQAQLLAKDVESARREFDSIQERANRSSLESETNQTNIAVLKTATPPVEPSSPRTILIVIQAIFLGIFFGIGTVIVLELRNRRIRVDEDLADLVGIPLMGNIPESKADTARALPIKFVPQLPGKTLLRLPSSATN